MITVRVHADAKGTWYIARCPDCAGVHKYPMSEAESGLLRCKACGAWLDLRGFTGALSGTSNQFKGKSNRVSLMALGQLKA